MKSILMVFALVLTISLAGGAANVSSNLKIQTENMTVSNSNSHSTMKSGKAKKAHHKHHKSALGSKKKK